MVSDRSPLPELAVRHPAVIVLRVASLFALAFSAAIAVDYYLGGHQFCGADGGCAEVRTSEVGRWIAPFLPALGLLVFPLLFAGSLVAQRATLRATGGLALLAGLGALGFLILQAAVIGHFCWLCVGVDTSALVAGGAGAWIVAKQVGEVAGSSSLASRWWPLFFVAFAPIAWALTFPDPPLPDAVRELWDEDADLNVVEMVDFECPFCRALHPVLGEVLEGVDGTVHVARIMVPLRFHPHARGAAHAYFCADAAGQREAMTDRLFATEDLSRDGLLAEARALELDEAAFVRCLDDPATDARVEADLERARRGGMAGLPTVFVDERVLLGFDAAAGAAPYEAAVEAALQGKARRTQYAPFTVLLVLALASLALSERARRG